jgi:hypothetical protein
MRPKLKTLQHRKKELQTQRSPDRCFAYGAKCHYESSKSQLCLGGRRRRQVGFGELDVEKQTGGCVG